MAIKPTIYKIKTNVSNLNTDSFQNFSLTLAQHPSETAERMMARLLAFCLNAKEELIFSKGISTPDEPDIWEHGLDGQLLHWIDVGEPAADRIKKATRQAKKVKVYSFNSKSDTWWTIDKKSFLALNAEFFQFNWQEIQGLAKLLERTMELSITITDETAYISSQLGECEVSCKQLT